MPKSILFSWLVGVLACSGCGAGGPVETVPAATETSADAGADARDAGETAELAAVPAPDLGAVAMRIVESADVPREDAVEATLACVELQVKLGSQELALARIDELRETGGLSDDHLGRLALRCAELGAVDRVGQLSSRVGNVYLRNQAFRHGIRYHADRGDCALAERFLDAMPEDPDDSYPAQRLAECLAGDGQSRRALEIVEGCSHCRNVLYKGGGRICGACRVTGVLEILVRAAAGKGDLQGAVEQVEANVDLVHRQVRSQVNDRDVEAGLKHNGGGSYWPAKEIERQIERGQAAAVAGLYGEIALAGLSSGDRDEALAIIDKVDDPVERDREKLRMTGVLAEAGEIDAALESARSIEGVGPRALALVRVSRTLTAGERHELRIEILHEAYEQIRRAKRKREVRDEMATVREELARAGDAETAWKAYRRHKSRDGRCKGSGELLLALGRAGMFDRAAEVFARCQPTREQHAAYVAACVRAGGHERVLRDINRSNAREGRGAPYGVVESFARACAATETCRPLRERIEGIESDQQRDFARCGAAAQLAEDGRIALALELLGPMKMYREKLAREIVASLTGRGDHERAAEVARSLSGPAGSAAAEALADSYAAQGDEEHALEWGAIDSYSRTFRFWLRLAEGLLARGDHQRAWECLAYIRERPADEWLREPVAWQVDRELKRAAAVHAKEGRFERALTLVAHIAEDEDRVREVRHLVLVAARHDPPPVLDEPELLRLVAERLEE